MRRIAAVLLGTLALAGCGGDENADDITSAAGKGKRPGLKLVKVGDFDDPVYVTAPDREHTYVVEQAGRIVDLKSGDTFLDIRDLVTAGGEQGLLSAAFAPDYAQSGRFYVYYTDRSGEQRVVEYEASGGGRADPDSARLVLRMADPESNHNGGHIKFGPDGKLYIATGDGGGGGDQHGRFGNAQDLTSLLGKILRIDPRPSGGNAYGIPRDNPFYMAKGPRGEIWAYGLRNPWRFDFDKGGDFVVADVGQDAFEEVDYVPAPKGSPVNFGWRVFEGNSRYASGEQAPGHVGPVMTFKHSDGNCSITGGVVARGSGVPAIEGRYVFGDFCKGELRSSKLRTGKASSRRTGLKVSSLSSFGEDGRGRVYVTSLSGPVYRIAKR